ncbi:MAG: TonB-dependent receptor [Bacteroidota bacterium]
MSRSLWAISLALLFHVTLFSQTVVGSVISADDDTDLSGVAIQVVGTSSGTTSDKDGRFTLGLPDFGRYQIRFSYLGYAPQTFTVEALPAQPTVPLAIAMTTQAFTTEALTVSATRADAKTPVTYVNLSQEDIAVNNLGQDLPFLLKWTPSVVVTSDAGAGIGYTGIWIRGSDPTRTNVTINGIPLNDSESQGVFWVNLPDFASSASDIQIQRGVGTSTNGAGAFGASININTNQLNEIAYGSLEGGIGSFGTRRANLRFGTGLLNNGFSVDGRLSRIHSDGYIDRARADLDGYYLSAAHTGEKSVLRFNLFGGHEVTYQAWNGVDATLVDDRDTRTANTAGTAREGEPYENEVDDYEQTHYQLHYATELGNRWALNLSGHYTQGAGFFEQYRAEDDLSIYGISATTPGGEVITNSDLIRRLWLDNDFYGLVYSLRFATPDEQTSATLGGGYSRYEGRHFGEIVWARFAGNSEIRDTYYDNDAEKTDFNVYGKIQHEIVPNLSAYADLQLRLVGYQFLGLDRNLNRVDQDVSHTFFNPKLGLHYRLSMRSEAYFSVGVAQREPNRNDFVNNPIDQAPKPEKLFNTELGYRTTGVRSNFGINFYHMLYRDQLVLNGQLNDVGEFTRINVPNSYRLGVEIQAGYAFTNRLTLGGNLALSRNRLGDYTEYLDDYDENFEWLGQVTVDREDTPLAFSPDILAGAELNFRMLNGAKQQLDAALLGKFVGRRYLDNSGDEANSIDPYFYGDFRINYALQPSFVKQLRISLLVNNLFDQLYSANGWSYRFRFDGAESLQQGLYPQATRNFLVSLGIDF